MARWTHWGLAIVVVGAIAGCPPGIDDLTGDSQRDDVSLVTDCGDRVEFSLTYRITYRMSASPEELGYQEFEMPTFP